MIYSQLSHEVLYCGVIATMSTMACIGLIIYIFYDGGTR